MFYGIIDFLFSMFHKSRRLFYRERMILNLFYHKVITYFNLYKTEEYVHTTKLGEVKGTIEDIGQGKKYYSFQGIPYGKPALGKKRFKEAEPAEPWTGVLDATKPGKMCLQKNFVTRKISGCEDCLNLNVYTPTLPSNTSQELKPVMVWIHGGAFITGSNAKEIYGPEYILEEDVVLVVINYRLGVLGFLNMKDPKLGVPGNAGFKDMVLALKWIQENIKDYNGDPNNVTIFGESAGSVSVHLLMLSPLTKGLFHRCIAQSGSSLNGWSHGQTTVTQMLGKFTDCKSTDEEEILNHLQSLSEQELFNGQIQLDKIDKFASLERYAGWVVEPPSETAFLTKPPVEIIATGDYHHVPIMMGYNNCEGMLYEGVVAEHNKPKYWEIPEVNVPAILDLEEGSAVKQAFGEKIVKFYLGEGPYTRKNHSTLLYDMMSDNCFIWGIYQAVRNHAKASPNPVYLYRFSVESHLNFYKHLNKITTPGVSHADDLGYLFKTAFSLAIKPNSIEDISKRRVCRLWTNFAKYGNPTPKSDDLLDVTWLPVEENIINFLDIGEKLQPDENPDHKRMAFWNDIYAIHPHTVKLL